MREKEGVGGSEERRAGGKRLTTGAGGNVRTIPWSKAKFVLSEVLLGERSVVAAVMVGG